MRKEYWLPITGFEGLYEVSNWGRVKSLARMKKHWRGGWSRVAERILTPTPDSDGYLTVGLRKDGKKTTANVHLLVWDTFVGEDRTGLDVNHIDENKENNCLWNLNLLTRKQNNEWGTRTERSAKTQRNDPVKSKAVVAKDPITLKVVCEFPSTKEAGRNGYDQGSVSDACRGCYLRAGNHTYKGLDWFYKN